MEEKAQEYLSIGSPRAGIAAQQMAFIEFRVPKQNPELVRVYLPLLGLEALIELLLSVQKLAEGDAKHSAKH